MQRERTIRTMRLAISCISNIASYRANWEKINEKNTPIVQRQFWTLLNGNFLDMAVLEWCKLFADSDGKHHWTRTFSSQSNWKSSLFLHMQMSRSQFRNELGLVSKYRNKYVAHLDDPTPMNYPHTEFMLKSVSFLHDSLKNHSKSKEYFIGYYDTSQSLYAKWLEDALDEVNFTKSTEDAFISARTKFQ
jgi:hypothetical protein